MRKLTYEEVKNYIESVEGYKLLSTEYINANSKLKVAHDIKECGYVYEVLFKNFKYCECRCPQCSNKIRYEYNYVKKYIEKEKGYHLLTDEYVNNESKLRILHDKCKTIYETTFSNFKNGGYRCPECSPCRKLRFDEVKEIIEKIDNGEYTLLSGKYINNKSKLEIQHKCGNVFNMRFNNISNGQKCPKCQRELQRSKGEMELGNHIISWGYLPIFNDRSIIYNPNTGCPLEFDIWIPQLNKAIEFNGIFYHSFPDRIEKDGIKKQLCEELGIELLVVKQEDWLKDKNKCLEQVKAFLEK